MYDTTILAQCVSHVSFPYTSVSCAC